nr:NADH dehydrogenase subunit 2 [Euprosopia sp. PH-2020]
MFNNSAKILFSSTLIMGTLITVSSNTWLSAWMGLEINLLSFIPLMKENDLVSTEASLKYFLTQALASAVLLFAIIMSYLDNNLHTLAILSVNTIIMSSLMLKTGTAPFHFWFPNVMEGLTWINGLILMTWQKIAPMMVMSYLANKPLIIVVAILSVVVGSLGGLNQTSLRKLMAFSSINHVGWMLTALQTSETMWSVYFLFYSFLSTSIIFMFTNFKLFHINQLFNSFFSSKILKFSLMLNLLSLGGLPPFLGFMPKWMLIQTLVENNQFMLMLILTVTTLITLFFYIRLCFSALILNTYETSWMVKMQTKNTWMKLTMTTSFISTFGLILISMIYSIL